MTRRRQLRLCRRRWLTTRRARSRRSRSCMGTVLLWSVGSRLRVRVGSAATLTCDGRAPPSLGCPEGSCPGGRRGGAVGGRGGGDAGGCCVDRGVDGRRGVDG